MRDDRERLQDILEAINRIEQYAGRGRAAFDADELIQVWTVHHLQLIGEACFAMSAECKARHPHVPWADIIGMRHILVHQYFDVDNDVIWSVVTNDLAPLKRNVDAMLRTSSPP